MTGAFAEIRGNRALLANAILDLIDYHRTGVPTAGAELGAHVVADIAIACGLVTDYLTKG